MYMRASAASALRKIFAFSHSKPAISFSIFLVLQVQITYLSAYTFTDRFPNVPTKLAKSIIGGGGGGGGACKFELFLTFAPPPPPPPIRNMDRRPWFQQLEKLCNGILVLQSTVRHYKTIKLNIKILLNIYNFQFFATWSARKVLYCEFWNFPISCPTPLHPKNGSTPLPQKVCPYVYVHSSL